MKKSGKLRFNWRTVLCAAVFAAVLVTALGADAFSMVSRAASAGKVSASSANVRKEPSAKSDALTGVTQDKELSIKGQTTGNDGYTWYQVDVDGVTGYVRSDLVTITDGTTPPTIVASTTGNTTASAPTTSTPDETVVNVVAMEPVGGNVKGASPVRVRQNASTSSRIVTTAEGGLALTVTGTADGTDGNQWYQVEYISNGSEVKGFIRADYVEISGELIPAGETTGEDPEPVDVPAPQEPVEQTKAWDTFYQDGSWHLVDNSTGNTYDPQKMIDSVAANTQTLNDALAKNKGQQIAIIILVILLIGMATVISYLIFKIKDMNDSAYFNEIERETVRRRTADRPQGSGPKVTHTPVGTDKRPAGQRPSGGGNGQRPAGQRPSGNGNGQRPAGQRPSGSGNGQRPAGQRPSGGNGQKPAGQKPSGGEQAKRPAQAEGTDEPEKHAPEKPFEAREKSPESNAQQTAAQNAAPEKQETPAKKNSQWKPKNFMSDDEDFEFTFLDWDGKEE